MARTIRIAVPGADKPLDVPVTDAWFAATIAPYPKLGAWSADRIDAERKALAKASETTPWTPAVRAYVQALDRVWNVHNSVALLRGRRHEEFGFDGADQIHHNATHYACGCVLAHVYDHHHHRARAVAVEHREAVARLEKARAHGHPFVVAMHDAAVRRAAAAVAPALAHARLEGVPLEDVEASELRHHQHLPHQICAHHQHLAGDLGALRAAVDSDHAALAEFHAQLEAEAQAERDKA